MSRENVELVRSVHPPSGTDLLSLYRDTGDAGEFARFAALLTDDFEAVGDDGIASGLGLTPGGRGIDGLVAAWRDWLSPWDTYWFEGR